MTDSEIDLRTKLRYETPSSKGRASRKQQKSSTPYRLKSAEKYLSNLSSSDDKADYDRYSRSSSPIFLREQIKAESQIRAERDADLKTLRRSVSPKQPKSPSSKSPRSRSTSPLPLKYSGYSQAATPYEEYRSAMSSLRNLRDKPSYIRAASPPTKGGGEEISYNGAGVVDSGISLTNRCNDIETSVNHSSSTIYKSPLGTSKSPTWHKLDKDGLKDAVEESESRRMLLVNRLKDAQDTLKLQSSTITSIKSEKERYKAELDSLNFSKEESYNEKRNLNTRIKLMKSKCDELDEEVKELSRTSQSLQQKMGEKTKQCDEKNQRINELENELSAIRLSSADNGDQISKLQDSYNRARKQASLLEQQHTSLTDQNSELVQTRQVVLARCSLLNKEVMSLHCLKNETVRAKVDSIAKLTKERDNLSSKGKELNALLTEAEDAVSQLKSDLAITERERRELEEERRVVISHKLDTQEALTKSNQVNMELQAQLDGLIDCRDTLEQDNDKLKCKVKAFQETVSNRELETTGRMVEIEALQGENETLREINDSLKDRVDDWERSKSEADHLIELLRSEKQDLLEHKTDLFNQNEGLNDEVRTVKIELGDKKQDYEMLFEEREEDRKEKIQLQQMLDTLRHDSDTQKTYMETQCEDLEKDIQRLSTELENLREDKRSLVKDNSGLKEDATYNKNKAEDWKSTAQSLEDSLNLSEQERKGVVEDLLRIQNELTDLKEEYGVVADERNRFLDKYNELRNECEILQEEVRELLLEKDENQHVTRLLETQKAILEEKWNGGKDLEAAQAECIELREDVNACRDRVKALEQSCDDLKNNLTISTDKVSTLLTEKKVSQENLGRADKTMELLNNDKDRLQKQVSAITREFENRIIGLEQELEEEQNKVLRRSDENNSLKKRLDEALNIHGTEKADLVKDRNSLEDKITAIERIKESLECEYRNAKSSIEELQTVQKVKENKENKLADALKAITGNPDVEDPYVEAANYMRAVKGERDCLDKEAALIPGMEANIKQLQTDLAKLENTSSSQGIELENNGVKIGDLESVRNALENNVADLENEGAKMEKQIGHLSGEKEKLDKLEIKHDELVKEHGDTTNDLTSSKKQCETITEQRDSMDVENKRVKAENTKLSIELTDFKKALASKGDGERAMMEASNELRVVKNELENLMDIISTKDTKIDELSTQIQEVTVNLTDIKEESEAKSEEIKTLRSQVRDKSRQKEREGELDLETTVFVREKEEQLVKYEKVIETYKAKIEALEKQRFGADEERSRLKGDKKNLEKQMRDLNDTVECLEAEADVMKEVLVETESEKETIETRNKDLKSHMELLLDDQAKDDVVRRLHQVEDELRLTKQKLQMSEDDNIQDFNMKDFKTPEEVAKIIEDIKEAFEDEIADLLLQERSQYEHEKAQFDKEKEEFRFEQEEFLRQAEEIAAEQLQKKNTKVDEMQVQLDNAVTELQKYKSGS